VKEVAQLRNYSYSETDSSVNSKDNFTEKGSLVHLILVLKRPPPTSLTIHWFWAKI